MAEKWKATGEFFDSCSCDAGCPCQFGSDPTLGYCDAAVMWHIKSGNYIVGVKYVPINVKIDGKKRSVSIPSILDVEAETITAMDGKEVQVVNGVWTESPGVPLTQGKSSKSTYKDFEWNFDLSGKSSRYAPFDYIGP